MTLGYRRAPSTLGVYAVTFIAEGAPAGTPSEVRRLCVTDGVAPAHVEGQPSRHLTDGESVWNDAGQRHWSGSTAEHSMACRLSTGGNPLLPRPSATQSTIKGNH